MKAPRPRYATARDAKRLAALARECGVDIANVSFHPDGRVDFYGPDQKPKDAADAALEEWERREPPGRA